MLTPLIIVLLLSPTAVHAASEGGTGIPGTGSCESCKGDFDGNGSVSIGELIQAVNNALNGCPGATPVFSGFDANDVVHLADDALNGRDNASAGSIAAQEYILDQIRTFADGLDGSQSGDDAYKQAFAMGTNILAVIPGSELPNEYVMVGAHYDHLGGCFGICNGATDNAAGVAAVLAVGRQIALNPSAPRRSVILALWDSEEDGLVGSKYYVDNPIVPLANTVAYVNFDIQGANLLPSLRNFSFAVAGETGGSLLLSSVASAAASVGLDTRALSSIFGQGRSDYTNFVANDVPTVFFSDSTGPCYHTAGDDVGVVDFGKLAKQSEIGYLVTIDLAETNAPPSFVSAPLVVFNDAVQLLDVVDVAVASDIGMFNAADQAFMLQFQSDLAAVVAAGEANFDGSDIGTLATGVLQLIDILSSNIPCDGFLE